MLPGFLEFSVERFVFRKFNSFGISGNFCGKFAAVSKVLVEGKGPLFSEIFENGVPFSSRSCRKFKPDVLVEWKAPIFFRTEYSKRNSFSIFSKPSLIPVSGLHARFSVNRTDLYKG